MGVKGLSNNRLILENLKHRINFLKSFLVGLGISRLQEVLPRELQQIRSEHLRSTLFWVIVLVALSLSVESFALPFSSVSILLLLLLPMGHLIAIRILRILTLRLLLSLRCVYCNYGNYSNPQHSANFTKKVNLKFYQLTSKNSDFGIALRAGGSSIGVSDLSHTDITT